MISNMIWIVAWKNVWRNKLRSLVVVEPPSLPETAEYPLRTYNLSTLLAVCLLLFAIVRLVLATVREHQD